MEGPEPEEPHPTWEPDPQQEAEGGANEHPASQEPQDGEPREEGEPSNGEATEEGQESMYDEGEGGEYNHEYVETSYTEEGDTTFDGDASFADTADADNGAAAADNPLGGAADDPLDPLSTDNYQASEANENSERSKSRNSVNNEMNDDENKEEDGEEDGEGGEKRKKGKKRTGDKVVKAPAPKVKRKCREETEKRKLKQFEDQGSSDDDDSYDSDDSVDGRGRKRRKDRGEGMDLTEGEDCTIKYISLALFLLRFAYLYWIYLLTGLSPPGLGAKPKVKNLRRNIRDILSEEKLEDDTVAAQKAEQLRLQRLQEKRLALREYIEQQEVGAGDGRKGTCITGFVKKTCPFLLAMFFATLI